MLKESILKLKYMQITVTVIGLLLLTSISLLLLSNKNEIDVPHFKFLSWARKFKKNYSSSYEYTHRLSVYLKNLKHIDEKNKEYKGTLILGENQFMDLEYHEFKDLMMSGKSHHIHTDVKKPEKIRYLEGQAPDSVDWRDFAVTKVKN